MCKNERSRKNRRKEKKGNTDKLTKQTNSRGLKRVSRKERIKRKEIPVRVKTA
jgi:hypothetical protein